ncbi:MAG: hypothetical protein HC915_05570, partial [Anaerolineae bacterium]|nr:hypothetical protein [Anaerolineae bacterium]
MKARRWLGLVALGFVLAACGSIGERYTLEEGAHLDGNQHLIAGEVDLEAGSRVAGNLNITAQEATVAAAIDGDLTIVSTQITLEDEATIQGDLIFCVVGGGDFEQARGAQVVGSVRNSCAEDAEAQVLALDDTGWARRVLGVFGVIFASLAAGMVAALGALFFPHRLRVVQVTAHEHALKALGWAFDPVGRRGAQRVTMPSPGVVVPLLLAPVILLSWGLVALLATLGAIALAQPFGGWLLGRLRLYQDAAPVIATVTGATCLTFVVLSFSLVQA